jgi:hypothetical protein
MEINRNNKELSGSKSKCKKLLTNAIAMANKEDYFGELSETLI